MVVLAPTGVAAINAGGQTIHSFFKIGFGPLLPNDKEYDVDNIRKHFKYNKKKIELLNSLELLIIDEVSMVRADLLDMVSKILMTYRNSYEPFGGVQTLLIGDVFQLPPVVNREEWGLLSSFYRSPFFFSSDAFKKTGFHYYELEKVYRQSDPQFIDLLNNIRVNELSEYDLEHLNSSADKIVEDDQQYVILATHNNSVNTINGVKLDQLETDPFFYKAQISGDFADSAAPTEKILELKEGSQVMFVRNDGGDERRYFNGTIGTVTELSKNKIVVKTKIHEVIHVDREEWENIKYEWDDKDQKIKKKVIGTWKQFPLRLAWAITVHKSQGLTFDYVIADLEKSFSEGQVYVALSRCTSFEGLVLSSPIPAKAIKINPYVVQFTEWMKRKMNY